MKKFLEEHPLAYKPAKNPDGAEGSKFWRVRFGEQAHWAAVHRQMRSERRLQTRRNTRGNPVGLPCYVRGPEREAANYQTATARARYLTRASKFARRVAASFNCKPTPGFEILYFPK